MTLVLLLQKLLVFGCLGILIEFFFTSIHSLLTGNLKGTGYSYIWMVPVYGFTALLLDGLNDVLPWPFYIKAFVYVPVIYGAEALSGWVLQKTTGHIPWDYKKSFWTPMGLINLKYAPFWLVLAMAFDPITQFLARLLKALAIVTD